MSRFVLFSVIAALVIIPTVFSRNPQDETSRAVAGGGITVQGWTGKVDAREASQGMTVDNAKFAKEGDAFHVVTGPAVTYWNPANKATGDYTVSAHFREPHFMNLNTHPHPYGIVIAGNDRVQSNSLICIVRLMATESLLCAGWDRRRFS